MKGNAEKNPQRRVSSNAQSVNTDNNVKGYTLLAMFLITTVRDIQITNNTEGYTN